MDDSYTKGRRVSITPFNFKYKENSARWLKDPKVMRFIPYGLAVEDFLQNDALCPDFFDYPNQYAILDERGSHIGLGELEYLDAKNGVGEGYIILGEKFAWGKGYAAEVLGLRIPYVFEERGLRRLEASCVAQNAAMVRLLEKAGFVREGVKRELFFRDGQWHDLLLYAMLKQDYLKNKPR